MAMIVYEMAFWCRHIGAFDDSTQLQRPTCSGMYRLVGFQLGSLRAILLHGYRFSCLTFYDAILALQSWQPTDYAPVCIIIGVCPALTRPTATLFFQA